MVSNTAAPGSRQFWLGLFGQMSFLSTSTIVKYATGAREELERSGEGENNDRDGKRNILEC